MHSLVTTPNDLSRMRLNVGEQVLDLLKLVCSLYVELQYVLEHKLTPNTELHPFFLIRKFGEMSLFFKV
jgi:hypothetical protein